VVTQVAPGVEHIFVLKDVTSVTTTD
jgi:hypothetical protein